MKNKETSSTRKKKWRDFISFFKNENNQKVFGLIFILFSFYFFISFFSFFFTYTDDQSEVNEINSWISFLTNSDIQIENSLGKFGALFSFLFVYNGFGIASFLIPGFLLFSGLQLVGYKLISLKKYTTESIWGLI